MSTAVSTVSVVAATVIFKPPVIAASVSRTSFIVLAAVFSMPTFTPPVIMVPISLPFPFGPIFFQPTIRYMLITGRCMPVVRRKADKGAWDIGGGHVMPRPVI